jgi:hypothetical protein
VLENELVPRLLARSSPPNLKQVRLTEGNGAPKLIFIDHKEDRMANQAKRYKVGQFVAEFDSGLREFIELEEGAQGFGRYLRNPARWYHELIICIVRQQDDPSCRWVAGHRSFVSLLYEMLKAWGMDQRGAKLEDWPVFEKAVLRLVASDEFQRCSGMRIRQARDTASCRGSLQNLWKLLAGSCRIMKTDSLVVGSSKLLHHLHPDFFPPIDRTYTLDFLSSLDRTGTDSAPFALTSSLAQQPEFESFYRAILFHGYVAREKKGLAEKIGAGPMSGSIPKLIDNALIGWWRD